MQGANGEVAMPIRKAKTEAQRRRAGVTNPKRTQAVRDWATVLRYSRSHPQEMLAHARNIIAREDEVTDEA
jgi:hypothetical protein